MRGFTICGSMPWRGHSATICKGCGGHRNVVGPLSARYKCAECSETRMVENFTALRAHRGPAFDHWRRRTLAAFGVFDVDERDAAS